MWRRSFGICGIRLKEYDFETSRERRIEELIEREVTTTPEAEADVFEERVDAFLDGTESPAEVPKDIKEKVWYLQRFFNRAQAGELVKEYGKSTRKWNCLAKRIRFQTSRVPRDKAIRESVYESFEVGERYTNTEIQEKLNRVNKKYELTETSDITTNKAVRMLKLYFDVSGRKKNRATGNYEYEILSDYPLPYPMKVETYTGPKALSLAA